MFADPVMLQEYKTLVVGENLISTWLDALASEDNEIELMRSNIAFGSSENIPGRKLLLIP